MNLEKLETIITLSAFNKQKYEVSIPVRRFINSLMFYINDEIDEPTLKDIIKFGVPAFQRDNNKWTNEMQIKFVENIIKGFVTKIQLFEITPKNHPEGNCQILDGLQRVTALSTFIEGGFKIFDNSFDYNDIKDVFLRGLNKTVAIEIFKFNSNNEAIDFYVEMNENITHSPEDIQKALSFKV